MEPNNYQRLIYPFITQFDAETIHDRTLKALATAQNSRPGRWMLRHIAGDLPSNKGVQIFGLNFPNVLGVAAGFDKDTKATPGLAILGFGHIEVGTITPQPQAGNPKPRVFRLKEDKAVINRMGFPSGGLQNALKQFEKLPQKNRPFVLGVSLGKQKETPLDEAHEDYKTVLRGVAPYADYLAVNVSSPNTPELRMLQGSKYLDELIGEILKENENNAAENSIPACPVLLKIAPDLTWPELDEILRVALDQGISGIIAANTSIDRPNLSSHYQGEKGGLSGRPLRERSLDIIKYISHETGGKLPSIGVGGIANAADVKAHLDAGASLVQIYTALIYHGPGIAGQILRQIED